MDLDERSRLNSGVILYEYPCSERAHILHIFPRTPIMRSLLWKSRALDEQLGTFAVPKEVK